MRELPGTIEVAGREFVYVEYDSIRKFKKVFHKMFEKSGAPMPEAGGMLSHNVCIRVPGGQLFFGVSYKGDIPGWRAIVHGFCESGNLRWATITDGRIVLSDGQSFELGECEIQFYEL